MKSILLFVQVFLLAFMLHAQEKAPEVGDDYASMIAGDTITINVMENDWGMEGHTISILNAQQGAGGTVTVVDSCLTYASHYSFGGTDSVRYVLYDENNGLFSLPGFLVIEVSNEGRADLDLNNVNAFVQSFGMQFCNMNGGAYIPRYEVPKGNRTNTIFVYNLWLGGLDANDELHLAAERYRSNGCDFWHGPVSEAYSNQQLIDYNKVWSFTREEIEYHRQHWWEPDYEPIENIASWPAHGNPETGQAARLAAFNDRSQDGEYNWDDGDYPVIRGDEGVFWLCNDDFDEHGESGGAKLKVEVHGQAYAFDCMEDSAFHNTLFLHFDIISRAGLDYHNFLVSNYLDFDLGYAWDDYVGCDTMLNAIFGYNGDDYDEDDTVNAYLPSYGYRDKPPAQALVYLNAPLHSFMGFSNYGGISGDPYGAEEIFNTMQGLWKDGTPITVGGNGTGGDVVTRYLYPGNPSTPGDWTELEAGNAPNDRRAVSSAGPFNLAAGDTLHIDMALVFARDYAGDNLSSVDLVKERIQHIQWHYDNDSTPCGKAWTSVKPGPVEERHLFLYPNPANDYLRVVLDTDETQRLNYRIRDLSGRLVETNSLDQNGSAISTAKLAKGVYILEISGGSDLYKEKFIKK